MATTQAAQASPTAPKGSNEVIQEQDRFYFDRITYLIALIIILCGIGLLLLFLMFTYPKVTHPSPRYFQMSEISQLYQESPLNQPNLPVNELLNWVVLSVMNANSFNFLNYAKNIESAQIYFTPEGFENFKTVFQTSKMIERIVKEKLVFNAVASAAPQITKEGPLAGRYFWKIKIPMFFNYFSVKVNRRENAEITLLVMRVPTTQSPNGVLIYKYEMVLKGVVG